MFPHATVRKPGATRDGKHSPEYTSWHSMKQRCTNPKNKRYRRYGARGIVVCQEWADDFSKFLSDMGPRPTPKHTLERRDNNGSYYADNCVWATKATQNRNHSRNHNITFNGETLCVTDWAARIGIKQHTLLHRLKVWPVERALTEPPNPARFTREIAIRLRHSQG